MLQGADFGAPARNRIEQRLRMGLSLRQIEAELRAPNRGEREALEQRHKRELEARMSQGAQV